MLVARVWLYLVNRTKARQTMRNCRAELGRAAGRHSVSPWHWATVRVFLFWFLIKNGVSLSSAFPLSFWEERVYWRHKTIEHLSIYLVCWVALKGSRVGSHWNLKHSGRTAHSCTFSRAGGSWAWSQPGLHSETMSCKQTRNLIFQCYSGKKSVVLPLVRNSRDPSQDYRELKLTLAVFA